MKHCNIQQLEIEIEKNKLEKKKNENDKEMPKREPSQTHNIPMSKGKRQSKNKSSSSQWARCFLSEKLKYRRPTIRTGFLNKKKISTSSSSPPFLVEQSSPQHWPLGFFLFLFLFLHFFFIIFIIFFLLLFVLGRSVAQSQQQINRRLTFRNAPFNLFLYKCEREMCKCELAVWSIGL